jgi:hypothetical protein
MVTKAVSDLAAAAAKQAARQAAAAAAVAAAGVRLPHRQQLAHEVTQALSDLAAAAASVAAAAAAAGLRWVFSVIEHMMRVWASSWQRHEETDNQCMWHANSLNDERSL